jgi:CubicO group peptidase (beta-lactamase class C family)
VRIHREPIVNDVASNRASESALPAGLSGHVHPDFGALALQLRRQIGKRAGSGAALCVFHRGECVADLWGGSRDDAGRAWERDTLALSFSTTKGVVATLLHVLVDRGALGYEDRVASHWPEFNGHGKQHISVRQLLCHEAGLWNLRQLIDDARCMLDWDDMVERLERAVPCHPPGERHGYHGLTWGWLVGELVQRVGGRPLAEQIRTELAEPLGLDGLHVGCLPESEWGRRAMLIEHTMGPRAIEAARRRARLLGRGARLARLPFDLAHLEAALLPPGMERLDWNSDAVAAACIPSANGCFTARSLARLYAVLAAGGELGGVKLLSRRTLTSLAEVQNRGLGDVVPIPMNWRLGFHRVPVPGPGDPRPFGHFGFGGSGAWADPARELAVACISNSGVGTPFGDTRILRLGVMAARAADRR